MELHASLKNTLMHNNLWLASEEIPARTFDDIGFVENSNPDYTNSKELEIAIEEKIMELVETDPNAAAIYSSIKGPKFIICTSKKMYGTNAVTEAIVIRTTNNNYGLALRLLGMISNKIEPHYVIRPKTLKKQLNNGGWDQLLRRHQGNGNNQSIMDLRKIDNKFFDIKINFQPLVENSQSITIRKFLTTIGRVVAIEPTSDTEELGKYIMIVKNKDYDHAKRKFDDILEYVYKEKDTLAHQ